MQSAVALYTHTRSWEGKKILEAGSGSGRPSRMFVNTYMQPGAVYYCSDFSPKFLEFFADGFKNAEFSDSIRIKFKVIDPSDHVDVEDFDSNENSKRVFLTQADSERLPYADESFDRYVSNFSLQYVTHPESQISEAFRVLVKGGIAGVSVGGRIENSSGFFTLADAMNDCGVPVDKVSKIFCLGEMEVMIKFFEDAGFKGIKAFYHTMHMNMTNEERFNAALNFDPYITLWKGLSDEKKQEIYKRFNEIFDERYGDDSKDPLFCEAIIVTGKKI